MACFIYRENSQFNRDSGRRHADIGERIFHSNLFYIFQKPGSQIFAHNNVEMDVFVRGDCMPAGKPVDNRRGFNKIVFGLEGVRHDMLCDWGGRFSKLPFDDARDKAHAPYDIGNV